MTTAPAFATLGDVNQPRSETEMNAVLFHAIRPAMPMPAREWRNFRGEASGAITQSKDVVLLCEDVWLITGNDPYMSLVGLIDIAHKYQISCKTLEFESSLEWQHHPHPE